MVQKWSDYESAAEKGPMALAIKIIFAIFCLSILVYALGYGFGWFGEASKVAQEEFGAKAALAKYEWFIDQSSRIQKMDSDVKLFQSRLHGVKQKYSSYGDDLSKWPLHIQTQYNSEYQQAADDLLSISSQRNNLVREYNASSQKFNWQPFLTRMDKPRETFQEYITGSGI